jgi:hypothetical protein
VVALGWSIAYLGELGDTVWVALVIIFRDFLAVGVVMATLLQSVRPLSSLNAPLTNGAYRVVANTLLLAPPSHTTPGDARVEWAYAFDVHTNAFFPFFLTLYAVQLFFFPVLLKDRWVCLWVGNTLYAAA